jgi:hypothetical protein
MRRPIFSGLYPLTNSFVSLTLALVLRFVDASAFCIALDNAVVDLRLMSLLLLTVCRSVLLTQYRPIFLLSRCTPPDTKYAVARAVTQNNQSDRKSGYSERL